jgi:hypothetical protein
MVHDDDDPACWDCECAECRCWACGEPGCAGYCNVGDYNVRDDA